MGESGSNTPASNAVVTSAPAVDAAALGAIATHADSSPLTSQRYARAYRKPGVFGSIPERVATPTPPTDTGRTKASEFAAGAMNSSASP